MKMATCDFLSPEDDDLSLTVKASTKLFKGFGGPEMRYKRTNY